MNKTIRDQLDMLKNRSFTVDGKSMSTIPEDFNIIEFNQTFNNNSNSNNRFFNKEFLMSFSDYIIKPFEGFDFHQKFNNDNITPFKIMKGIIIKETEKMYYIKCVPYVTHTRQCSHCLKTGCSDYLCEDCRLLYPNLDSIVWQGWIPKKSVIIKEL